MHKITPIVTIRVAMALIFQERRAYALDQYVHGKYYNPAIPVNDETRRLQTLSDELMAGRKILKTRETHAVLAKVAQSFRLKGWEYEEEIFGG